MRQPSTGKYCKALESWQCPRSGRIYWCTGLFCCAPKHPSPLLFWVSWVLFPSNHQDLHSEVLLVRATVEGFLNTGNELLILDPYSVCLWPPAPCTLTTILSIESIKYTQDRSLSFTCLRKIDFPNSSPMSEPKSHGGRAPLGGEKLPANSCLTLMQRLLCSMLFNELVNVSSQRALIQGSVRCTVSR